jgi:hypothetical protein
MADRRARSLKVATTNKSRVAFADHLCPGARHEAIYTTTLALLRKLGFFVVGFCCRWQVQVVYVQTAQGICDYVVPSWHMHYFEGLELLHVKAPPSNFGTSTTPHAKHVVVIAVQSDVRVEQDVLPDFL